MKNSVLIFCCLLAIVGYGEARELKSFEADTSAPPLNLRDLYGNTHDLDNYRGHVILVNFWATWCPPCVHEMPSMQRLHKLLREHPFRILAINNARGPLSDVRVRRALAHAVDRQAVIDGAMFGYGTPIGTHFAPHHPAYVDLTGTYPYDPEKAKALLAEAGFGEGLTLSLKLPPPSYARRGGEIVAAQLAQVGVTAEISQLEWAGWLEQVFRGGDYDLTIVSHTEPMDIGIYARDKYYFAYQDADFKALMAKLNTTVEEDARYGLLADAQKKLSDDSVNVFLFQLAKHGVWNKDVVGLWENSPVQANDLTAVYWK